MPIQYLHDILRARRDSPQSKPEPGQVANSGSGFSFEVDDFMRLQRFLILGCEGGSYYAGEHDLAQENTEAIERCLAADPERAIGMAVAISEAARAPKNDPAIYVIALAMGKGSEAARQAAAKAMPRVCRTGTHLFTFAGFVDSMRGWGSLLREAVAGWYAGMPAEKLALQLVKYRTRTVGGRTWTHGNLIRLSHVKTDDPVRNAAIRWAVKGEADIAGQDPLAIIEGFEAAQQAASARELIGLIERYRLPHEALPTRYRNDPMVWEAMLPSMPAGALIRNLSTMTRIGLVSGSSEATRFVVGRLWDAEFIRKGRIHPMNVLFQMKVYAQGHGNKGRGKWTPVESIVNAMDSAFYLAFPNVESTGKRFLIGLDVSGSMQVGLSGFSNFQAREAACAQALVTMQTEDHEAMCFSSGFVPAPFRRGDKLLHAMNRVSGLPFMRTDCSLPITWALENRKAFDVFLVLTDSETNCNSIAPHLALQRYREALHIPAKLVVVAMVSNRFTIANPNDAGMLDVVGFDAATPQVIADFARA
ncbi:MAG TPA: TROVE domain-containing protein [Armatimonadota bacterium]|jgi:60 kDa SS-A/Ro ribonucleoprotein